MIGLVVLGGMMVVGWVGEARGQAAAGGGEPEPKAVVAGEVMRVPGTKVRLTLPAGFKVARAFVGLEDKARGIEIQVGEFPTTLAGLLKGLEPGGVLVKTHAVDRREEVRVGGRTAYYARGKQKAEVRPTTMGINPATLDEGEVRQWVLVGNSATSVLVTATYPIGMDKELDEEVRVALLSMEWVPEERVDVREQLPFTFAEPEGLKLGGSLAGRVNYTEDGRMMPGKPETALISLFATRNAGAPLTEAEARRQFVSIGRGKEMRVTSIREVTVGGLRGYELSGEIVVSKDQVLSVYTQTLVDGEVRYSLFGQIAGEKGAAWVERFRATAQSIRGKPSGEEKK